MATFDRDRTVAYFLQHLRELPEPYTSAETNRLTLCYFCLSGLHLLDAVDKVPKKEIIDWIYNLQLCPSPETPNQYWEHAGFIGGSFLGGPFIGTESSFRPPSSYLNGHLAMTYTAIISLVILGDDLSRLQREPIARALFSLQDTDGNFVATSAGGEKDLRFVYCAAVVSRLLGLDKDLFDKDRAVRFIMSCWNYDGGFGLCPGQESHGGAAYVGYAALVLMEKQDEAMTPGQKQKLGSWCLRRQSTGGFQGRCNKLVDTCYSFWIGGTLQMLGQEWLDMMDKDSLREFLLRGTQTKMGGFSKVPGIYPDVLHSYFGLCGLSLIGSSEDGVQPISAMFGMAADLAKTLSL